MVAQLDQKIRENANSEIEKVVSGHQCKRTKHQLQKALYHSFDVHKKERFGGVVSRDNSWLVELDEFLERMNPNVL